MTTNDSTPDGSRSQLLGNAHFVLLPFLGFVGAAWATGFPMVNPLYSFETRSLQCAAILTALCSGLAVAVAFRSTKALKCNRLVRHFVVVAFALVGGHFLWVEPIWGFHHHYSLGIFAWLFLGGEDGFVIIPNVLGLTLTAVSFFAYIALLRSVHVPPSV